MKQDVIALLTAKNDKSAYELTEKIIAESVETDCWYAFFDDFASLLNHPKSLVRNRALSIIAANARWDTKNRYDVILPEYLSHITDEKPITARQCIKALVQLAQAKPEYIPQILSSLENANLTQYSDSMRPLIEKDIKETTEKLKNISL